MADTKAQQRAEVAIAHNASYNDAVKSLKNYYEDNRLLLRHHYDEIHKPDNFKDTVEDLDHLENHIQSAVRGLESSNGYSATQFLVAALEKMLYPGLARQWRKFNYDAMDPPPISQLLAFIHRQKNSVPDDRLTTSSKSDKQQKPRGQLPNKRTAFKLQESSKSMEYPRDKCLYCNDSHAIFLCAEFKAFSPDVQKEKIKSKRLCFNCLGGEHAVTQCHSRRRCKRCQGRHHILLHRDDQTSPALVKKEPRNESTTTSSVAVAHQKPRAHYACFPRTVLASASAGSYRQKCRAQLDTGAMLSLVASKLAHSIRAKQIHNTLVTICSVGGEIYNSHDI